MVIFGIIYAWVHQIIANPRQASRNQLMFPQFTIISRPQSTIFGRQEIDWEILRTYVSAVVPQPQPSPNFASVSYNNTIKKKNI